MEKLPQNSDSPNLCDGCHRPIGPVAGCANLELTQYRPPITTCRLYCSTCTRKILRLLERLPYTDDPT